MNIVIAMDSYKGCLSAFEVGNIISKGIMNVFPDAEIINLPMADGGEGTVQTLVDATNGEIMFSQVTGPLGEKVDSYFGILGDRETAVIEMSAASGLPLVPEDKRNPLLTTTFGTGELIKMALDMGCRKFLIGIGGSATNDGGAGMAQALGVKLLDKEGKNIGYGGGVLDRLHRIDTSSMDPRIDESTFLVACDVDNPLWGPNGASYVYGPQKGATEEMIVQLDRNLRHFSDVIKKEISVTLDNLKGGGAAGGLGAGLVAFLNATLKPGVDIVINITEFREALVGADYVITGEGKIDGQTIFGKTPIGVAKICKEFNVPVIAIGGSVDDDGYVAHEGGIDAIFSIINYPLDLEMAMRKERATFLIEHNIEEIFRLIKIATKNKIWS